MARVNTVGFGAGGGGPPGGGVGVIGIKVGTVMYEVEKDCTGPACLRSFHRSSGLDLTAPGSKSKK